MSAPASPPPVRQSRRQRRSSPVLPGLLAAVFLLGLVIGYLLPRPSGGMSGQGGFFRPKKDPPVMPDWVTVDLLPENEYSRPGTALDEVRGIVVHYVGNPGTSARNNRNYFESLAQSGEAYASSHFIIGLEGEVLQCVPLDEISYCSNSRNDDTIAIECCHPDAGGAFNQSTYDSLVALTAYLAEYYELSEEDVIRHYDITGKECPKYYVDNSDAWQRFLDEVFSHQEEE